MRGGGRECSANFANGEPGGVRKKIKGGGGFSADLDGYVECFPYQFAGESLRVQRR